MKHLPRLALIIPLALLAFAPALRAAAQPRPRLAEGVATRHVDIWSDGTRLSGDLFSPKGMSPDHPVPVLILCHGWGGARSHLNLAYAPAFAEAGFAVLTFDYRGWGDSDSRLVIKGPMPKPDAAGEVQVTAVAVRELVDPFDQIEDIGHCLDFMEGEPGIDAARIGLWGTSYGGGHALTMAVRDPRIKCAVSQIASMDSLGIAKSAGYPGGPERAKRETIQRARGEGGLAPVPQGVDLFPNLKGTPFVSRMIHYRPVELAPNLKVPLLIIDAGAEELFDIKENGGAVYEIVKALPVPTKYVVMPGLKHYDVYGKGRTEALGHALEWFKTHLAAAGSR